MTMEINEFVDVMEELEDASGSNAKQDILKRVFPRHSAEDNEIFVRLVLGELFDDPEKNTNVSKARVLNAASELTGVSVEEMKEVIDAHGKPSYGVEFAISQNQQQSIVPKDSTLEELYSFIQLLPQAGGDKERRDIVKEMLSLANTPEEAKWISYSLLNDLSVGTGWKTVAKAFAEAEGLSKDEVYKSKNVVGTLPEVVGTYYDRRNLVTEPILGKPFNPMLASGADDIDSFGSGWVAQTKYDGARVLVHNGEDDVRLFSRGRQDVTDSLPEIASVFQYDYREMILDCEVVAYRNGEIAPFQHLLKRFRRKEDIDKIKDEVSVHLYIFDILMKDGRWIGDEPAFKRYDEIPGDLHGSKPLLHIAEISNDIESHYAEALDKGHEGVIVKKWDAPWSFDRSDNWQKLKPSESLDLRVAGITAGTGKHADRLGAFILETEDGVRLGNVGTGFSDEERGEYDTEDMIGKIVEVTAEELQETDDGYGLRFPRFEAIRSDKEEADDLERVEEILE